MCVKWVGLEALVRGLLRPKERILVAHLDVVAQSLFKAVKTAAPYRGGKGARSRTHLRQSIGLSSPGYLVRDITEGAPWGIYVRKGTTGGYPIEPRTKKALYWPGLPHPIQRVNSHPGIRANPYHERALAAKQGVVARQNKHVGGAIVADIVE